MALKVNEPALMFSGAKLTPDELDQDQQYIILNPSVDPVYVGTAVGTQTQSPTVGITNTRLDYPRSLSGAIAAAAGSVAGGTISYTGLDQFGSVVSESVVIAPATGGGTVYGTQVFATVTSATVNLGTGDPGNGSARIGVGIGTSATKPVFGLPAKLGGTADIKAITWIDSDVAKMHTAADAADTTRHGVILNVAGGIAAADSFVVTYRSSFNATNDGNIFTR